MLTAAFMMLKYVQFLCCFCFILIPKNNGIIEAVLGMCWDCSGVLILTRTVAEKSANSSYETVGSEQDFGRKICSLITEV